MLVCVVFVSLCCICFFYYPCRNYETRKQNKKKEFRTGNVNCESLLGFSKEKIVEKFNLAIVKALGPMDIFWLVRDLSFV